MSTHPSPWPPPAGPGAGPQPGGPPPGAPYRAPLGGGLAPSGGYAAIPAPPGLGAVGPGGYGSGTTGSGAYTPAPHASPYPHAQPGPGAAQGAPFGPYLLERELGRGGMGVVYKAYHQGLRRGCAVKVLNMGPGNDEALQRFLREGQAVAKLGKHTHIVQVFDAGHVGHTPYLAMEYIEGRPLDQLLKEGPLSAERALEIGRKLALALDHAHQRGIVHRDVKPGNVIIDADDEPHVLDFGLAKDLGRNSQQLSGLHSVVGTPAYMAPEQACPDLGKVDRRSDVYSVGAVLYHCLSGQAPFGGPSMIETLVQVIREDPPPLPPLQAVPAGLEAVVRKALSKEPAGRYQTALELADDLGRVLAAERPRAAGRPGVEARLARFVRGHGPAVALAGFAVAAALSTVLALVVGRDRAIEAWSHQAEAAARTAADRIDVRLAAAALALADLDNAARRGLLRPAEDGFPGRLAALLESRPAARRLAVIDLASGVAVLVERDDEEAPLEARQSGVTPARMRALAALEPGTITLLDPDTDADDGGADDGGARDGRPDGGASPTDAGYATARATLALVTGTPAPPLRFALVIEIDLGAAPAAPPRASPPLASEPAIRLGPGRWLGPAPREQATYEALAERARGASAAAQGSSASSPLGAAVVEADGALGVVVRRPGPRADGLDAAVVVSTPRDQVLRAPTRFALVLGAGGLAVLAVAASLFALAAQRRRRMLAKALPVEMWKG